MKNKLTMMMTLKQFRAATLFALLAATGARAEQIEYSDVAQSSTSVSVARLLQKDVPLTLVAKNLDSSWQFITLNAKSAGDTKIKKSVVASIPEAIDRALRVAPNVYLTKWQTVQSGAQTFLVAYRVEPLITSEEFRAYLADTVPFNLFATRREFLDYLKTHTETRPLKLTLLNLQNIDAFSEIEPYDIAERDETLSFYITMSGFREVPDKIDFQSQSNLKYLATAVLQYAQEHDEKLPPLQNMEVFKKAIFLYVRDNAVFVQPFAKKHYVTNGAMTNKGYANIQFASQIALLYEAQIGSDGKRAVAFADGHVKRVSEAEWTKIKKVSKIK